MSKRKDDTPKPPQFMLIHECEVKEEFVNYAEAQKAAQDYVNHYGAADVYIVQIVKHPKITWED